MKVSLMKKHVRRFLPDWTPFFFFFGLFLRKDNKTQLLFDVPFGKFPSPGSNILHRRAGRLHIYHLKHMKRTTFLFNITTKSEIVIGFSRAWNTLYEVITNFFSDNFLNNSKLIQSYSSNHLLGHGTAPLASLF